ncbi:MFS transporter [Kerstersia gyiorum]|uniref:MFS transporter n=1 Tax=Kerstersia gyiorum TaxID=206506 RepID=UPI00214FE2C9|nr:MFS transporter [Kerstersia gyiorum]MCR4158895.1 MFS transporter [Kerstersia gyiorum]
MSRTASSTLPENEQPPANRDWHTITLVGIAHATSHFFQLVIPTLYTSLGLAFGLDYAQLGLLVSLFFVASGVGQASSGFIVDRIGARSVLWFGLGSFMTAGLLISAAPNYTVLILASLIAGLGNSVFHPVDYAIINQRIHPSRLGHAFSLHLLTGSLGWALAPVFLSTISVMAGWRSAALCAGLLAGVVLLLCLLGRDHLGDSITRRKQAALAAAAQPGHAAAVPASLMSLLRNPVLWAAFAFFATSSLAFSSVQNYTIPILENVHHLTAIVASSALSGYMVASALGMLAGGFMARASARNELVIGAALVLSGLMLVLVALNWIPSQAVLAAIALAGFFSGIAGPSRDMLIRRVTPKGSVGAVYGLVYSGMDVGAALGPLIFGVMMDAGKLQGPWLAAGASMCCSAMLAAAIARGSRPTPPQPHQA